MGVLEIIFLLSGLIIVVGLLWLLGIRMSADASRSTESSIWWATAFTCVGILGVVVSLTLWVF
jgi:hypothetical protein